MIQEVRIGPIMLTVILKDEITGYEDDGTPVPVMGMCCINERTIYLSRVPDIIMQYKYLVHEMLEAYQIIYDLQLSHDMIIKLETIFFDMITSNPELIDTIGDIQYDN